MAVPGLNEHVSLTDMQLPDMELLAESLGQARFRGRQLFEWVHAHIETDLGRMSNLPKGFAAQVGALHPVARAEPSEELVSSDGSTRKRLLRLADGKLVEAVLMEARSAARASDRHTVCVSSQVGCALACSFCVTGQVGFSRQLSPGEIVEQVYHFERELRGASMGTAVDGREDGRRRLVSNVVFMGMGEPLANYEAVMAAVRLLSSPQGFGLGARRITISTAGLVPGIHRLAGEGLELGLAISLHAASDELRTRLMPVNRRYGIAEVLKAADGYAERTGRRVTYEYAMIDGVNDRDSDARALARLLSGRLCHVNLIPLNQSLDPGLRASAPAAVAAFKRTLEGARIPCTLRETRGQDILAACGQLRYTAAKREARSER